MLQYMIVHQFDFVWRCSFWFLSRMLQCQPVTLTLFPSTCSYYKIPGILCILFLCTNHLYTSLTQTQHLPITKSTTLSGENYLSTGSPCFDKISLRHTCERSKWNPRYNGLNLPLRTPNLGHIALVHVPPFLPFYVFVDFSNFEANIAK